MKRMVATGCAMLLMTGLTSVPAAAGQSTTLKDAGEVASQPARDVGLDGKKIPAVLVDAADDPYATPKSCAQISAGIRALNDELGPDFGNGDKRKDSLAKRGGAAVVNSLIPFRGIVREVSGAAASDRKLAAATQAGIARRGFLRGLYQQRGCRSGR